MSKHTPGPKFTGDRHIGDDIKIIDCGDLVSRCSCHGMSFVASKEDTIKYFSLHAAAPELLEACKKALKELIKIDDFSPSVGSRFAINEIHNAIRKAEGGE